MLETLITSKTRLRLLVKFFVNAANQAHMRGLADEFGESTNAIRKELNNLSEAGYLEKEAIGNKIEYRANTKHPLFTSLQSIVRKYLGLDTIIEKVVDRLGEVQQVWLIGDYAQGKDAGLIEVVIVGKNLDETYSTQLSEKIESHINRKLKIQTTTDFLGDGLLIYEETTN
jgi:hypothetical protein